MSSAKNPFAGGATAFVANVSTSVLLIYSNKYLMSKTVGLGFSFGNPSRHLDKQFDILDAQ